MTSSTGVHNALKSPCYGQLCHSSFRGGQTVMLISAAFFILVAAAGSVRADDCPTGWELIEGRCLLFPSGIVAWQAAVDTCRGLSAGLGATLPAPGSNATMEMYAELSQLNGDPYWTAFNDIENEGE